MKIVYVGIRNIMGINELEFSPGSMTLIEGKNGRGKTSVLKGLQAAIGGGHDATLIKEGHDKGEVVVVFDDGMKLEKRIKEKSSKLILKDVEGKEIPKSASFLKEIVDHLAINPIKILTANPKDRVKLLLDSIGMTVPFDDIEAITKTKLTRDDTRHPLHIIQEARGKVYEERADNNRFLKEKKTLVNKMRDGIPFKSEAIDYTAELNDLELQKEALERENKEVKESEMKWQHDELNKASEEKQRLIDDIEKNFQEKADDIKKQSYLKITETTEQNNAILVQLSQNIGDLKAKHDQALKLEGQIKYIQEGEQDIKAMEDDSEALTKQIDQLDKLKAKLLDNLPIEGLKVKDGDLYLDGVVFDNVNRAKQIQFALSIAGMRKTELPIVCVDNLEALDKESFGIFQEQASKTDMQFFVTRVSEEAELRVNTDEN